MNTYEEVLRQRIYRGKLKGRLKTTEIAASVNGLCGADCNVSPYMIDYSMIALCDAGYAAEGTLGGETLWEIHEYPLRVFGFGKGSVYLFYDPHKKSQGIFACRIGYTEAVDVRKYVDTKTKNWGWKHKHKATIALIFKTDAPKKLEGQIHHILKRFGRWRKDYQELGLGREWFDTAPDEVLMLYEHIRLCDERGHNIFELYS